MEINIEIQQVKFEKIQKTISSITGFLSLLIMVCFLVICSTPFVFIWGTFVLSVKVFFTGLCGIGVLKFLHFMLSESIRKAEISFKELKERVENLKQK